jgi:hypothetical protein
MSTAYTLDVTTVRAPVRRSSSFLELSTSETSPRYIKTFAKIFLISAAALIAVSALLAIHIENPSLKDRGCIISANPHHSLVRSDFSPSSIDRVPHAHGLPILSGPIDTDWIATSYCDQP